MKATPGSPPLGRDGAFSGWLDLFRCLAAFAVLYGHARPLFFTSLTREDSASVFTRALYFLSGFGHTAVMVFFVLSGFLVGGAVIRATHEGRWSWWRYATQRGTRLYIVLIPALFLTLIWDYAEGVRAAGLNPNNDTAIANIRSSTIQEHTGAVTFAGNLVFLQTILVPPLGSNTPLWSLTNEFWYYVLFPLLWLSLVHRGWRKRTRICCLSVAIGILAFVGGQIALYFTIWLLGCVVWLLPETPSLRRAWARGTATALSAVGVLIVLFAARTARFSSEVIADFAVGLAFAGLLYCLKHNHGLAGIPTVRSASARFADFSYTLYLVHLPPLIFLRACLTYETSWSPTLVSWAKLVLILLLVTGYAYLVSLVTERQTERVRRWLESWSRRAVRQDLASAGSCTASQSEGRPMLAGPSNLRSTPSSLGSISG